MINKYLIIAFNISLILWRKISVSKAIPSAKSGSASGGKYVILIIFIFILCNCSFQKIIIRSTSGIIDKSFEAVNEETDLKLAEQSSASSLKLLDGLLKGDPENEHFLLLGAQGYIGYSLGFVEDEDLDRARTFYLRGRDYTLKILQKDKNFNENLWKDTESFEKSLRNLSEKFIPAVFWCANAWANYINISRDNPEALADIPKILAMSEFVISKNERYFYGCAYMIMGSITGSIPKALGGSPEKAKEYFEKCIQINDGKFLMVYIYYASIYAVQVQNRELYESLLKKVISAPIDILPEQKLANSIAKKKAEQLLKKIDEYF